VRRRLALVALASAPVLSLLVALAGAGPVGAVAPAALLVALGAPVLAAGVLASAGALAGAVGGLLEQARQVVQRADLRFLVRPEGFEPPTRGLEVALEPSMA
jgi:hypothetical protein